MVNYWLINLLINNGINWLINVFDYVCFKHVLQESFPGTLSGMILGTCGLCWEPFPAPFPPEPFSRRMQGIGWVVSLGYPKFVF